MRQKQRQIIAVFTIFTMLLPPIAGCGLRTPNVPTETTGEVEETTTKELTTEGDVTTDELMTEEPTTEAPERTTEGHFTEESTTEAPTTKEPTTEESTTETLEPVSVELAEEQAKREVLVLGIGDGEGQVGYRDSTSPAIDDWGPQSFAVVEGKIYILDVVNGRIICFADGKYSEITVENAGGLGFMQCTGEEIYLATYITKPLQFYVYGLDGTKKLSISLPKVIRSVNEILKLDDTSVEFDGNSQTGRFIIKFDWETQKYSKKGSVSSSESRIDMAVRSVYTMFNVLAETDDDLFYECYDGKETKLLVNRQTAEGSRWYMKLLNSLQYYSIPQQRYYVDSDGKLYMMECFDDRTVISELLLGE